MCHAVVSHLGNGDSTTEVATKAQSVKLTDDLWQTRSRNRISIVQVSRPQCDARRCQQMHRQHARQWRWHMSRVTAEQYQMIGGCGSYRDAASSSCPSKLHTLQVRLSDPAPPSPPPLPSMSPVLCNLWLPHSSSHQLNGPNCKSQGSPSAPVPNLSHFPQIAQQNQFRV